MRKLTLIYITAHMAKPDQLTSLDCCEKGFLVPYECGDHALYKVVGFMFHVRDPNQSSQECLDYPFRFVKQNRCLTPIQKDWSDD